MNTGENVRGRRGITERTEVTVKRGILTVDKIEQFTIDIDLLLTELEQVEKQHGYCVRG